MLLIRFSACLLNIADNRGSESCFLLLSTDGRLKRFGFPWKYRLFGLPSRRLLLFQREVVIVDAITFLAAVFGAKVVPRGAFDVLAAIFCPFDVGFVTEDARAFLADGPGLKMGLGRPPYAFTEQGVAMLSSVLRSKRAVQVNVEIMRTFVRLRRMLAENAELSRKLAALEQKYDKQFKVVFDAIRQMMAPPRVKPNPKIGFRTRSKT
ncbi:MAG: hypothetical protein WBF93_13945 [Pirellulales bacterium]